MNRLEKSGQGGERTGRREGKEGREQEVERTGMREERGKNRENRGQGGERTGRREARYEIAQGVERTGKREGRKGR